MDAADQVPREKALFEQALYAASAAERLAFLHGACGEDAALLARVQALLQAHETAEGFLPEQPAGQATLGPVNEKPGDRIGRYKLRERIGEGGCGVVYVAEQQEPVRRKVALKVVKLGMDTRKVVARFQAERQALALMDHPNIAQVHDAGATETGRPYFVMELVRGTKITDYCDQQQLSTRERLELFIKVCQAVQHAHQKGVIHRDLKPSKILVTVNDGVPVPKAIDFGIAKATTGRLTDLTVYTDLHQFIGTPAYMSPEQATMTSLDIDTRSDIYSLGVLLYELLTGHTPFDTKELMTLGVDALRRTIREKEPMRPSTRLSTMLEGELTTTAKHRASAPPELIHLVRGDLNWIVMKCLEKDRARRYETANGLAFDLKRHLNNEPVLARPPSTVYRLQKAWRRHKLAFTAAAVMAGALVVGTGVSSWQAVETSRARKDERKQRLAAQAALYVANIIVAQQAWDQNNMGRLRQSLEETQNYLDRGFEWYYLQKQAHLDLETLRGHLEAVLSVAASPDGHRIVTGSGDNTAIVWEGTTGKELLTLKGHRAAINSAAFSPDSQRIITGSDDQTAKVWEAASGRDLLTLKGHNAPVVLVEFSPDGQRIVTGSEDLTARVWEAARAGQVAAWQEEERTANRSLATLQSLRTAEKERQRIARNRDSIKQWLILAPIPLGPGRRGVKGLDFEQIEGEGRLRPKAGEAASFAGRELEWRAVALENCSINFNAILGHTTEHSVAYAVCYLRSQTEQHGLQMLVGSDDESKIYLNGKQVYRFPSPRGLLAGQDAVPDIALNAGLNVLVFKVVNEGNAWMGAIRFTDSQGNPVKGIKMTLDLDAKDAP